MIPAEIYSALRTRLATLSPAIPVQWEGMSYLSSEGDPYLKTHLLPVEPRSGVGANAVENYEGIFQITCVYPFGDGSGAAESAADSLVTLFKRGTSLTFNSTKVLLVKSWRGPAMPGDGIYQIPVSVRYQAFLNP